MLAEYGCDVSIKSRDGSYPLLIAAAQGHEQIVQMLIKCGATLQPKSSVPEEVRTEEPE